MELFEKVAAFLVGEARSHLARKAQRVLFEVPDEQRAKGPGMLGLLGITADHQFLLLDAFRLQPVVGAPTSIRRVRALRDDALQRQMAGVLQDLLAGLREMLAVLDFGWAAYPARS